MHHVFAEFFGARVGIVVGARPVDGGVLVDDFVLTVSGDGHGGDMRIAPQAVAILGAGGRVG